MDKTNDIMGTTSVRLDDGVVAIVRKHKEITGFPIARFIEDAIADKLSRLPKKVQKELGILSE